MKVLTLAITAAVCLSLSILAPSLLAGNGDVDCNDMVNISDIIYLIAWMFGGGPDPCDYVISDSVWVDTVSVDSVFVVRVHTETDSLYGSVVRKMVAYWNEAPTDSFEYIEYRVLVINNHKMPDYDSLEGNSK